MMLVEGSMIDKFLNQLLMVLIINGGFLTGELILGIVGVVIIAYFWRKGDRNPLWIFIYGYSVWAVAEVGMAAMGFRWITIPIQLLGGITVSYPIPSLILAIREGGVPTVLSYLFAKYAVAGKYRKAALPLLTIAALMFQEQALKIMAANGIPFFMQILGIPPLGHVLSWVVWNHAVSIRWLFSPGSVGAVTSMTIIGFLVLAKLNGQSPKYWKFAAFHYTAFAFYITLFCMQQPWAYGRLVAIPVIGAGAWTSPISLLFTYMWIVKGLPWIPWLSWMGVKAPVEFWLLPANFEGSMISHLYDILNEAASSRLALLTVPFFLKIVEMPEEAREVEVAASQKWMAAAYLAILVVPVLLTAIWLSSLSDGFLAGFAAGLFYGAALLAVGAVVLTVIYVAWRAAKGQELKWW